MRRKILGRCLGTVALAAAALLIARLDVQAAPPEDNKEVPQLLEDIKGQAADLQRDSDELESFTRSDLSWQSHAEELDRIACFQWQVAEAYPERRFGTLLTIPRSSRDFCP
jgi:hypothetical protein